MADRAYYRLAVEEYVSSTAKEGRAAPDVEEWLAKAAKDVCGLKVLTHVAKLSHPSSGAMSNVRYEPDDVRADALQSFGFGSHSLGESDLAERNWGTVFGGAGILYVRSFLELEIEGARVLDLLKERNPGFIAALADAGDAQTAGDRADAFLGVLENDDALFAGTAAKQTFLSVTGGVADSDFNMFCLTFSDPFYTAIAERVRFCVYSKENKEARKAFRNGLFFTGSYLAISSRQFVRMKLGGSQPQNVSSFNSARGGWVYLAFSGPPAWRERLRPNFAGFETVIPYMMMRHHGISKAVRDLIQFLKSDPPPIMATRRRRKFLESEVVMALSVFTDEIRRVMEPGWSAEPNILLPEWQRKWLDTGYVPVRENPVDWPERVAEAVSRWIVSLSVRMGLKTLGDTAFSHWMAVVLKDMTWQDDGIEGNAGHE